MSEYINPAVETKEEFLARCGRDISREEWNAVTDFDGDERPVIWVDNGWMTAAAVLVDVADRNSFTDCTDTRPMKFYMVSLEDIRAAGVRV